MEKKYYKCSVCGDIHFGVESPEICPTCKAANSYQDVSKADALKLMGGSDLPGVI